jgi:hypothetical protein
MRHPAAVLNRDVRRAAAGYLAARVTHHDRVEPARGVMGFAHNGCPSQRNLAR